MNIYNKIFNNGQKWSNFLVFAFSISDYFSLTTYGWTEDEMIKYSDYYNHIYQLSNWEITKNNPNVSIWGEYKKWFYLCNFQTYSYIKPIQDLYEMIFPNHPEDLTFYINEKAWFSSVTHEKYNYIDGEFKDIIKQLFDKKLI